MAKDRLTQHIEDLKADIESLKVTDTRIARYVNLQESLARAESVNKEILAMEEKVPTIAEPKERMPRARKQAKMPEMNGGVHDREMSAAVVAAGGIAIGDRFVTEPAEGTSGD